MFVFLKNQPQLFPEPLPAKVEEDILSNGVGQVKFQASLWRAKLYSATAQIAFLKGQTVSIVGREGLTLLVQPGE